jgi:hypothetical protein
MPNAISVNERLRHYDPFDFLCFIYFSFGSGLMVLLRLFLCVSFIRGLTEQLVQRCVEARHACGIHRFN